MKKDTRKDTRKSRNGLANYLRTHPHQGGVIAIPDRKIIYMKPGKTAGTSILRGCLEKRVRGVIHEKDSPTQFYQWISRITDEDLNHYYIFSVVRNPWDRAVSAAMYFELDFQEYIEDLCSNELSDNVAEHALPQCMYTHVGDVQFVDRICRFETLDEDLVYALGDGGLGAFPVPHLNRSKRRAYKDYYSVDLIRIVGEIYQRDIELYGYQY